MPRPIFNSEHEKKLAEIIRVDHAGELGANRIYAGQIQYTKDKEQKKLLIHMLDQELEHLDYFAKEIAKGKSRPTALMPIWNLGGYLLGAISAKIDPKTAMLVTEAVEEVIENHYQQQIDYLKASGEKGKLLQKIKKFKQDETEHKHIAMDNHSSKAKFAKIGKELVKKICQGAIFLSKKI
ncbi:MAG: demethoxyubiquinone hydroxylase family protein [Rickettsiaceae bacterium]|nr:demethoxyubiquinone hydroxylase family protein [Rickettsiaceae bacterium]